MLALIILNIHLILRGANLIRFGILVLQIFDLALNLSLKVHAVTSCVDLADRADVCGG